VYNGIEPIEIVMPHDRPDGFLIVSIGRLVPWKGMDGIVRVIAREPKWHAVIVGDGPERARLEDVARSSGCAARVRFVGQLPRAEALGWAKASDVFVLNSSYEGLSHTLLEVMSLDIPALAWAVGGNRELIEDAPSLPDSRDETLQGRILGVAMGRESARERAVTFGAFARTFTITRTVDETVAILRACESS
jgi:glycosyltransferase involved in cell wall biosynthesis